MYKRQIPDIVIDKSPDTIDIAAPPNPKTSIVDATTIFLDFPKSILFSIKTFNPFIAIKPYSSKETPPNTGSGIVEIIAVNLPRKPKHIAIIAANTITQTDAILVIPTTDVFSPYVVFAGPPSIPATKVAIPSPSKVPVSYTHLK